MQIHRQRHNRMVVLTFYFFGDWMRDARDPMLRRS